MSLPVEFEEFRQTKLEDGEEVVMLRGRKRLSSWPSNNSHAGMWGEGVAYILAEMPDGGRHAVIRALSGSQIDELRENDCGFMVLGSPEAVRRILAAGPPRLRGIRRRRTDPSEADRLKSFRFKGQADA